MKKQYMRPECTVVDVQISTHLLAGSQSHWADSKENSGNLWEDDDEDDSSLQWSTQNESIYE